MRALVVYCHPKEGSFTAAIRDLVLAKLQDAGAEVRLTDLYKRGFDPVLSAHEMDIYLDTPANRDPVSSDVDDILWCDTLIFVYPTWWYGLPAMLKGWLDRVLLPDVAFLMPDEQNADIRRGLTHIKRLGVLTTCGASWGLTHMLGAPGKRTILRGVRSICHTRCKTMYVAHYLMDSSTDATRQAHLQRVARKMDQFIGAAPRSATREVRA
ncbi:NAD(P)H-dependent oxidoreductase [Pseudaestuariivita rosea]|uniref:NAD(P)H-dependent oxidoreductase n=1 Tax=Pseudaestuariivita rosea TaxID=2763263 RepID=UPI001ABA7C55|nr:NAD(P)H-dependent oxidoreductase [Pseudaestuariivita rosea]